jgi:ABC-type multidrug transport system ATPase subunit
LVLQGEFIQAARGFSDMAWTLKSGGFRYPSEGRWVLRGLDLQIQHNEVVRIVGRNGSGKSTLLRILGGEEKLTEGELISDQRETAVYLDQFAGQSLANDLTIRDHLMLAARPGDDALSKAVIAMSQYGLGLEYRLDDFVGHLSGGQKQVVALTCVLMNDASLVCLDEFTVALMPSLRFCRRQS